jgi:hypothetical protein
MSKTMARVRETFARRHADTAKSERTRTPEDRVAYLARLLPGG